MYGQLFAAPQTGEDKNSRGKAPFRVLPDGQHEHHLVDVRTEATVSDFLRNSIKAIWQKQQDQNAEKVGRVTNST